MKPHLTIRTKIVLMVALLLLLITLCGNYILLCVSPLSTSWTAHQDQASVRQQLLVSIKANFGYGEMIHNFKHYGLGEQEKFQPRVDNNLQALLVNIKKYQQLEGITPSEIRALEAISHVAANYYDKSKRISRLLAEGRTADYVDAVVKIGDKSALVGFEVLDKHYLAMTGAYRATIDSAKTAVVTGLLLVAVVITWVLVWLFRSLIPPLLTSDQTMTKTAEGDLSVRLKFEKEEELGGVAVAFNHFVDHFEVSIAEEKQIIEEIKTRADHLLHVTQTSHSAIKSQLSQTEMQANSTVR